MKGSHAAFAAALLLVWHGAAGRVLVEGPGITAALDREAPCGEPVSVRIESDDPEVFAGGSPDLQAVVDAVHAVLTFECPATREIELIGTLRGIPEPVYEGHAARADAWRVQAATTVGSSAESDPWTAEPPADAAAGSEGGGYALIGVRPGMGVDETSAAVAEALGATPQYDPRSGRMTLHPEGCPQGEGRGGRSRPAVGSRCLTAWFTDQRIPRVYMVVLEQTLGDHRVSAVEQTLTERFGQPSERAWREARGTPAGEALYLGWGRMLDLSGTAPTDVSAQGRELEAVIAPGDGLVVTTVVLTDADLAADNLPAAGASAVDLKL